MTPPPGAPTAPARESGPLRRVAASAAGVPEPEPEDTATPQPRSGAHALTGWSAPPAVAPPSFSSRAASPSGGFAPLGAPLPLAHEDFGRRPFASTGPEPAPEPIWQAAPTAEILRGESVKSGRANRTVSVIVAALALLGAAGAVVHFKVIPLEVLAVWNRPAALVVDSEPSGATAFLDGRTLPGKTPLTVEVKRDRASHRIELSRPGYVVGETSVRFDRTVPLQATVHLEAEPPPPPPAEPTPSPSPTSVPPATSEAKAASTAPADLSAEGTKGKRAKSEHKAGKGAHARTAEAKAARKAARSHRSKASKAGKARSKSARAGRKGAHPQDAAPSGELF